MQTEQKDKHNANAGSELNKKAVSGDWLKWLAKSLGSFVVLILVYKKSTVAAIVIQTVWLEI
jgi:hypothetical protein